MRHVLHFVHLPADDTVNGCAVDPHIHWGLCCDTQGIELSNPTPHNEDSMRSGTESYFSEYSGFRSLKQPAQKTA